MSGTEAFAYDGPLDERFVDESCFDVADLPDHDDAVPSESAVVAEAETAPLTQTTIAWLAGVDPADLDEAALVGYAIAWTRVANHAAGQVARAIADYHDRIGAEPALGPVRLTAAEFGPALALGSGAADALVHTALSLAREFPDTLSAVLAGGVSWSKAATLVDRTAVLSRVDAAVVEQCVLPHASGRTPAQHAAAVRRAADRVDPDAAEARRTSAEADIALVREHVGDGMGELFARLPSEQLDTVWTAADTWARQQKAAGHTPPLERLRVQALVHWAETYLLGSDTDGDLGAAGHRPTRHGRPVTVRVLWDAPSLLGVANRPGELADSAAVLPASVIRHILDRGVTMRRLVIDPDTGELLDLTPETYRLAAADGDASPSPFELHVTIDADQWTALADGIAAPELGKALAAAPAPIQAMLTAPLTAEQLDDRPDTYAPSAALADFVATRDRHPTSPGAGRTSARAADLDHTTPYARGGRTTRANLHTPVRRWHRLRTLSRWRVTVDTSGWTWISPTGRTYRTRPHDYRHGP